jgi:hypothetical protein
VAHVLKFALIYQAVSMVTRPAGAVALELKSVMKAPLLRLAARLVLTSAEALMLACLEI